jgi:hypothetical protein
MIIDLNIPKRENLLVKKKIYMMKTRLEGPACDHTTQLELSLLSFYAIYIYKDKLLQHIGQEMNRCLQARFHLKKNLVLSPHIHNINDTL